MFIYWVMFTIPALASMLPNVFHRQLSSFGWFLVALLFVVIMGFRFETGADWSMYMLIFFRSSGVPLEEVYTVGDPAYVFVNWMVAKLGIGFYGVNLACATIFLSGMVSFCRRQPNSWLAF
ncbi:MAG: EpsG family protein, partial [Kordiimonadaceae bacterium]|nr:EpsG family protein [Kordiimonadaceae bacterium]